MTSRSIQKTDNQGYSSITLADGRRLAYAEYGNRKGSPVIYCHGFPGSRLEAALMDASAKQLGLHVIAPDRPGYGQSDFQPGRRLSDWPTDIAALLDTLSVPRCSVLAISGGGPYALACAEHLADRIDNVSIVCGLGPADKPGATRITSDPVVHQDRAKTVTHTVSWPASTKHPFTAKTGVHDTRPYRPRR